MSIIDDLNSQVLALVDRIEELGPVLHENSASGDAADALNAANNAESAAQTATDAAQTANTAATAAQAAASAATDAASTASSAASTATDAASNISSKVATTQSNLDSAQSILSQAQSAAALVQGALTSFNKVWLGQFAEDPTTDSNGDPLADGVQYLNTSDSPPRVRVYVNGAWQDQDLESEQASTAAQLSAAQAGSSASSAENAASAAQVSAVAAALSETNATAAAAAANDASSIANTASAQANDAKVSADGSAQSATGSASLAQAWASQQSGTVDGTHYSASYSAALAAASADQAASRATDAGTAASAAASSAQDAAGSAVAASTSAAQASDSASAAGVSAGESASAATAAATSATAASQSASAATDSAESADASATAAMTAASDSAASATASSQSASDAANGAAVSQSSAQAAADAVADVDVKVAAASTSASDAATSADSAESAAVLASQWASQMAGLVDGLDYSAKYYATNAANSATQAQTAVSAVAGQAVTVANNASLAQGWAAQLTGTVGGTDFYSAYYYAQQAATFQSEAASHAGEAASSADTAASSANAAAASLSTVQAVLASFNELWLGAHDTPPSVDGNGDALKAGAEYEDTSQTPPVLMVFDGSEWVSQDGGAVAATSNAQLAASQAAASASSAASSAGDASRSATAADASAGSAATSAGDAVSSASSAGAAATSATQAASAAASSASDASASQSSAANAAQLAQNWASQVSGYVQGTTYFSAYYYAQQASTLAAQVSGSATSAASSATAAATSETNAAASAATAQSQATASTSAASAAAVSEANAAGSATAAGQSAATASSAATTVTQLTTSSVTLDLTKKDASIALSSANNTATFSGANQAVVMGTSGYAAGAGKFYFEITFKSGTSSSNAAVGLAPMGEAYTVQTGYNDGSIGAVAAFQSSGNVYSNGSKVGAASSFGTAGNVVGVAVDFVNKLVWFRTNAGNWNGSATASPASGTGGLAVSSTATLFPTICSDSASVWQANFGGQSAFTYTPPAGFSSWAQNVSTTLAGVMSQANQLATQSQTSASNAAASATAAANSAAAAAATQTSPSYSQSVTAPVVNATSRAVIGGGTDDGTSALQLTGIMKFMGTGNRITGDFNTTTYANRVMFQSTAAGATGTSVGALAPTASGGSANFTAWSKSDPTNASIIQMSIVDGGLAAISSGAVGTGTNLPLAFMTSGAERMRIDTSGRILVATTTGYSAGGYGTGVFQVSTSANTVRQMIQGHANGAGYGTVYVNGSEGGTNTSAVVFLNSSNVLVGSITASASATAYNTTSDYRLKHNVVRLESALDRVMALKPSKYAFKHDPEQHEHEGFLAHELAEHVPRAVTGKKDATWHHVEFAEGYDPCDVQPEDVLMVKEEMVTQQVDYSKLVPVLTAALQEVTLELRAARSELVALRAEVEVLKH